MKFVGAKSLECPGRLIILDVDYCKYEFLPKLVINITFKDCCFCHTIYDGSSHLLRYPVLFLEVKRKKLKYYAFFSYPIIEFETL